MLATIGYEKAKLEDFMWTLKESSVEVLVDIRERAQSRRAGFSKSALSNLVENAGIEYLHFRELGDPKEGRDAARSGQMELFTKIFNQVMQSAAANQAIVKIETIAKKKMVCLLCYERDHRYCHRKIVSDRLEAISGCKTLHLGVPGDVDRRGGSRRVLYSCEGTTTSI